MHLPVGAKLAGQPGGCDEDRRPVLQEAPTELFKTWRDAVLLRSLPPFKSRHETRDRNLPCSCVCTGKQLQRKFVRMCFEAFELPRSRGSDPKPRKFDVRFSGEVLPKHYRPPRHVTWQPWPRPRFGLSSRSLRMIVQHLGYTQLRAGSEYVALRSDDPRERRSKSTCAIAFNRQVEILLYCRHLQLS